MKNLKNLPTHLASSFSDNFTRLILESETIYVVKTSLDGEYTYVNENFCRKFGGSIEDYLGVNALDTIWRDDHYMCSDTVYRCLENPNKTHRVILRKPTINGISTNIWDFCTFLNNNGQILGILCVGYEVNDLMQQRDQMHELLLKYGLQNERLIDFIQTVAHDTRAKIGNMIGLLDILDINEPEEVNELLVLAKNSIHSLDVMLQSLYKTIRTKLTEGIKTEEISISNLLKNIETNFCHIIKQENVTIIDHTQDEILKTNATYLESILFNLFTNAIKYRSKERLCKIEFRLKKDEFFYRIEVQDNGIGIDLEKNGKDLFGAYKKFHGNYDSTGLGLFITYNKVKQLGGEIKVESQLNIGTTFQISLPIL